MDVTPSSYFHNVLGNLIVDILAECSKKQNSPIEFIADSLERAHYSKTLQHINAMMIDQEDGKKKTESVSMQASLYFQNAFGSYLQQSVKETLYLRSKNPINFIANQLERFVL